MVEQLPSQNHPEILPGRPRFADQLPAMLICAVLMAIAVGIAGWSGQGMIGKWAGPGIGGLLVGAVTGFSFPLLVCVSMYWGLSWLAFSQTKANLVTVALWALILFPTWLASGWSDVLWRLLRFIPVLMVLGLIAWLIHSAMKRYPPATGEPTLPT